MKVCTECRVSKPISDFAKSNRATGQRSARGGMGVVAKCKTCIAELRSPGINTKREVKAQHHLRVVKKCGKCNIVKPFNEFHKRVASVDGLAHKCMNCVNADSRAWRERNPNAHSGWYERNADHKAQYFRLWRGRNRESERRRMSEWAKANPAKINALIAKRNAAKLRAIPRWANLNAIEKIYETAMQLRKQTGERYEVDHIVPLQSKVVSGLHWEGNLQILPKAQNISKHNRHWPDMPL
jgi:hypothetical protein